MAKLANPTVGRMVHFMPRKAKDTDPNPRVRAAIVDEVRNANSGECSLYVIDRNGCYFDEATMSEEPKAGYWSWPPKV